MTWLRFEGEVPEGAIRVLEAGGKRIAVCRYGGEYFAIDDVCTHDGGPLDQGDLIDGQAECPRHGARFDIRTGRALTLPAVRGVKTYATRLNSGAVEVELP